MFKTKELYGKVFIDVEKTDEYFGMLYSGDLIENVNKAIDKIKDKLINKRVYVKTNIPHRVAYLLGTILPNICEEVWFYSDTDLVYFRVS